MWAHYLKVALRRGLRQRGSLVINVVGLAVGIACFLLVVRYVRFEQSYDTFHADADRIHRVIRVCERADGVAYRADNGAPMAPMLQAGVPAVEGAVRLASFYDGVVRYGSRRFTEERFFFADPSVFDVFTFPLLAGDSSTALREPSTVVLTPDAARRYFGEADPVGQTLTYAVRFAEAPVTLTVTGVLAPVPANSHLQFDFLASFETLRTLVGDRFFDYWQGPVVTYVTLREGVRPASLTGTLDDLAARQVDPGSCDVLRLTLQPLADIYFSRYGVGGGVWKTGDPKTLRVFLMLGVFVLLIACINFMNLATARAALRAQEVGIRKVFGGRRSQLIRQFLGESLLHAVLALGLGLLLVEFVRPVFNSLTGAALPAGWPGEPVYLLIVGATALGVGLVAGSYPAFVLSAFEPVRVLKGRGTTRSGGWLRKALVTLQFALSVGLIVGALTVYRQLAFVQAKDLGFARDQILVVPVQDAAFQERYPTFKATLQADARVRGVTAASQLPGVSSPNGVLVRTRDREDVQLQIIYVDFDYVPTLGVDLAAGRAFDENAAGDATAGLLVNQAAADALGWTQPLGERAELYFREGAGEIPIAETEVVGVVADFNFRSLSMPVQPVLFKVDPGRMAYVLVRVDGPPAAMLDVVRAAYERVAPGQPFDVSFLDQDIAAVYRSTRVFGRVVGYGTALALFVACLGLFGLASFMTASRTREIGLRKVLGASALRVVGLLTAEFAGLVGLACVLAAPVAYVVMDRWLDGFAYRIELSWQIFLSAGLIALLVAFLTVGYRTVRAALANPVDALRHE